MEKHFIAHDWCNSDATTPFAGAYFYHSELEMIRTTPLMTLPDWTKNKRNLLRK